MGSSAESGQLPLKKGRSGKHRMEAVEAALEPARAGWGVVCCYICGGGGAGVLQGRAGHRRRVVGVVVVVEGEGVQW